MNYLRKVKRKGIILSVSAEIFPPWDTLIRFFRSVSSLIPSKEEKKKQQKNKIIDTKSYSPFLYPSGAVQYGKEKKSLFFKFVLDLFRIKIKRLTIKSPRRSIRRLIIWIHNLSMIAMDSFQLSYFNSTTELQKPLFMITFLGSSPKCWP